MATAAGEEARLKPHAVVIPLPLQGHITPCVELSVRLAARGFFVTFVVTEHIHHQRAAALSAAGRDHGVFSRAVAAGLDIKYEVVPDGFPATFDRDRNFEQFWSGVFYTLPAHVEQLLRRVITGGEEGPRRRLTFLVHDTFFEWPAAMAKKFAIPCVSFMSQTALVYALYDHVDLLIKNGHFGFKAKNRKDTIDYIPGVSAIEPSDLPSYLQEDKDSGSIIQRCILRVFDAAKNVDCVLCNTVEELEPETIAALRTKMPFYAIGPVFVPDDFERRNMAASLFAATDCSAWLDSKADCSVLYISFGSWIDISKKDLREIADGVLASNANFLWVLRPNAVGFDGPEPDQPLPEGFAEEAGGRGLVVPWCRQTEVLSHRAVGGFLTHCGWNSVLESAWCGVPLLCFPLLADQFTNRKLIVQEWRIGMSLGDIGEAERGVVRERIRMLMNGEEGGAVRKEMAKFRATLQRAHEPAEGSSRKNLDQFINDLMTK